MKRIFMGLVALSFWAARPVVAAPQVVEAPFEINVGATAVSCSSFTWTALGTSATGTYGMFVKGLDSNTGNIRVLPTASSSAPSTSTGTYQWSLTPTSNASYLGGAGKRVYFWCVTSHTAAETAVYTEVRPVR